MPPEALAPPLGATPPLAPTAPHLSAFADSLHPMKRSPDLLARLSPNPNLRIPPPKRAKPTHQPHRKKRRKIHQIPRPKRDNSKALKDFIPPDDLHPQHYRHHNHQCWTVPRMTHDRLDGHVCYSAK